MTSLLLSLFLQLGLADPQIQMPGMPSMIVLGSSSGDWSSVVSRVAQSVVPVQWYKIPDPNDEDERIVATEATPGAQLDTVCTAIVIDRKDMLLLTESHCEIDFSTKKPVEWRFGGLKPEFVYRDGELDLALVKTVGRNIGWRNIEIRKEPAYLGLDAGAYGCGMGLEGVFGGGSVAYYLGPRIFFTVPITRGHSGAPIFDRSGRLITVARGGFQPYEDLPTIYSYGARQSLVVDFITTARAKIKAMQLNARKGVAK